MSGHEAVGVVANRFGSKTIENLHSGCELEHTISTVCSHSHGQPPCLEQLNALLAVLSKVPDGALLLIQHAATRFYETE